MASGRAPAPYTPFKFVNLQTTPQQVKGTGGTSTPGGISGYHITNNSATIRYVKFYDTAAAPTVGTTIPVLTLGVPPVNGCLHPCGFGEIDFKNGIWVAATVNPDDNDSTAPSANDIVFNTFYF